VLELAGLDPVVAECSRFGVPSQRRSLVEGTELVVGVQDGLLLLGQLDCGLLGGLFGLLGSRRRTTSQSVAGSRVVGARVRQDVHLAICKGSNVVVKSQVSGRLCNRLKRNLRLSRDCKEGHAGQKERSDLDHDCCRCYCVLYKVWVGVRVCCFVLR